MLGVELDTPAAALDGHVVVVGARVLLGQVVVSDGVAHVAGAENGAEDGQAGEGEVGVASAVCVWR